MPALLILFIHPILTT